MELCAADVYMALSTHPDIREGSMATKYTPAALVRMAEDIYKKYGKSEATISGINQW